jgi:ferric enterobactin receptor
MYKTILSLVLLLSVFNNLNAQNSLSGKILDENNKTVFFATVILYNQADSSVYKTTSSGDDGRFSFSDIKEGGYYLNVRFLGYQDYRSSLLTFPEAENTDLIIQLEPHDQEIETVEVVKTKPLLQQESDRLVVNVADNITSGNTNLMDVMKKVPGVIVIGDKISLAGTSNVTILINGKTTKYMDVESLLRDMPGDNIQKVEIIHQPGAEFDAAGSGPILNIILKKNNLFGTNGNVSVSAEKGELWRNRAGVSLSHYQGNVNIQGSLGYRDAKYKEVMIIERHVSDDLYDQYSDNIYAGKGYRANLGADWDINERHRVGFQSRFVDHDSYDKVYNITNILYADESQIDQTIRTDNIEDGFWRFGGVNPYYIFKIDTTGQKLELDFNYLQFNRDSENILTPTDVNTDNVLTGIKYNQPGKTMILVGKLDYSYPFSKALKLQVGTKYSLADLDNNFLSAYKLDSEWVNDTEQTNHYLFDETIIAAYSKLSYNKDKWSGTLGLRYEDSNSNGRSIGIDTVLNRRIKKIFPSASISREIAKGVSGILAYSYRLDRPRYTSLNPFRYLMDAYTSFRGNPELRPEFTHSTKFSLAFQSQPFFNIEYKQTQDAMIAVVEQNDETGESFRSTINIDTRNIVSGSLFFPLDFIPGFSGYGGVIANKIYYHAPDYLGEVFEEDQWSYTGFLQAGYSFPWDIKAEVSGWYNSGGMEGLLINEWMYGVSFGLSKSFLDNRLKVSLSADDVFHRFYHGAVDYSNMNLTVISEWDAPDYSISLSYRFGNRHLKTKKHQSGASEEMDRAQQD